MLMAESYFLDTTRSATHLVRRRELHPAEDRIVNLLCDSGLLVASLEDAEDLLLGIHPDFDWRRSIEDDLDGGTLLSPNRELSDHVRVTLAVYKATLLLEERTRGERADLVILHPRVLRWLMHSSPVVFKPARPNRYIGRIGRWSEGLSTLYGMRVITADHVPEDYCGVLHMGLDELESPGFDFAVLHQGLDGLALHTDHEQRNWLIRFALGLSR